MPALRRPHDPVGAALKPFTIPFTIAAVGARWLANASGTRSHASPASRSRHLAVAKAKSGTVSAGS